MSNTRATTRMTGHVPRHIWFHLLLAAFAAGAIVAFASVPLRMSGLVSFLTVIVAITVDRSTRFIGGTRPRGRRATTYSVLAGLLFVVSLGLAVAAAHFGEAPWVAWMLAVVVFVVALAGAWVPDEAEQDPPIQR
ncbi:hypothetical protein P5G50_00580 [Leifsonia sp. F6_8S_P_1B]|uniref:Uncharacterized protein n=1 Tax=Leifsonia williamsii TaxID=3035919 RepID=A0ABT8K681_9MICO|nr:hypothetical protein [Leifsonia williamsii]MDN4612930.1 hypothetical protein [Leifsonia williamsii]